MVFVTGRTNVGGGLARERKPTQNTAVADCGVPAMMKALLLALLRFYRAAISPWLGNVCRFEPSCSRYSMACIEHLGAARGCWLTLQRLCKCHPFHPGGYDPPPISGMLPGASEDRSSDANAEERSSSAGRT
jgi:putative membrane protein insertion efficiency factor